MTQSTLWPDRVRLPLNFDPVKLAHDLDRLHEEGWVEHFVRSNYSGDWDVLPLRYADDAVHPIMKIAPGTRQTGFVDGPLLERSPYLTIVLAHFTCPLRSVRLMRLAPGSRVLEHFDLDLAAELGTARLHIPIMTNPDVEFLVNGVPVRMAVGSTWYLRLSDPHSVFNGGTTSRVHLVIDCAVDDWLRAMLDDATAPLDDPA